MSLIIDKVYLSNVIVSRDLKFIKSHKISHILIAAKTLKQNFPEIIKYKQLPISDNPTTNIYKYFLDSVQFIDDAVQKGHNILIHCLGGKSRSATITIAYVMIKLQLTTEEALDFVKKAHRIAMPNPGFLKQLNDFEKVLTIYFNELNEDYKKTKKIDFYLLNTCMIMSAKPTPSMKLELHQFVIEVLIALN